MNAPRRDGFGEGNFARESPDPEVNLIIDDSPGEAKIGPMRPEIRRMLSKILPPEFWPPEDRAVDGRAS